MHFLLSLAERLTFARLVDAQEEVALLLFSQDSQFPERSLFFSFFFYKMCLKKKFALELLWKRHKN